VQCHPPIPPFFPQRKAASPRFCFLSFSYYLSQLSTYSNFALPSPPQQSTSVLVFFLPFPNTCTGMLVFYFLLNRFFSCDPPHRCHFWPSVAFSQSTLLSPIRSFCVFNIEFVFLPHAFSSPSQESSFSFFIGCMSIADGSLTTLRPPLRRAPFYAVPISFFFYFFFFLTSLLSSRFARIRRVW